MVDENLGDVNMSVQCITIIPYFLSNLGIHEGFTDLFKCRTDFFETLCNHLLLDIITGVCFNCVSVGVVLDRAHNINLVVLFVFYI